MSETFCQLDIAKSVQHSEPVKTLKLSGLLLIYHATLNINWEISGLKRSDICTEDTSYQINNLVVAENCFTDYYKIRFTRKVNWNCVNSSLNRYKYIYNFIVIKFACDETSQISWRFSYSFPVTQRMQSAFRILVVIIELPLWEQLWCFILISESCSCRKWDASRRDVCTHLRNNNTMTGLLCPGQ